MDHPTFTLQEPTINFNQNSIFKELLTQLEIQITSPQRKVNQLINLQSPIDLFNYYAIHQQNQYQTPNKSISQWVWKDDIDQSLEDLSPIHDMLPQTAQLKRVQSMRMQQQNKLSQFIRSNNLINEEDDFESGSDIKQTMGLSPRKKKRIDKEKEKNQMFFSFNIKKAKVHSGKQSD